MVAILQSYSSVMHRDFTCAIRDSASESDICDEHQAALIALAAPQHAVCLCGLHSVIREYVPRHALHTLLMCSPQTGIATHHCMSSLVPRPLFAEKSWEAWERGYCMSMTRSA